MGGFQGVNPRYQEQKAQRNMETKKVSDAVTLEPDEQIVYCTTKASTGYTITLPRVSQCYDGQRFFVYCENADEATEITVDDQGDGSISFAVGDNISAVGDYVLVECVMGLFYRVVAEVTT